MSMLKPATRTGNKFQNPVETGIGTLAMLPKFLWLLAKNKEERFPRHPLGPFRTDPSVYLTAPRTGLRITWMGHSAMLIEIDGFRVLVDPVWDPRASPVRWLGPKRFFDPPLPLDELPRLDAVLISHDHYDHLGKDTVRRLAHLDVAKNAQWVTSSGVGELLRSFGVAPASIAELDWTQSLTLPATTGDGELKITALPARHFSGRSPWNRFETLWSSFVLKGPRHNLYFGADSGLWPGFTEIGQQYGPFDLTMLDTGAFNELWKAVHMGPDGAAEAFTALGGSGLLMPIHWALFDLALHGWRQPIQRITQLADERGIPLWSPQPGLPTEVVPGQEHRSDWWRPTT
jgi:L-ascorbate metabolism protein UlaG (beta-lactamase superfamily)